MRLITLRILGVLAILALAGCAGTQVQGDATESEIREKSIVVLSVSHDVEVGNGANTIFYLDDKDLVHRAVLRSVQDTLNVRKDSDFTDRRGHLYILEVRPGHHQIDAWQVVSAGVRYSSKTSPLEFQVHKGEVLYIGSLHANLALGHRMLFGGGRAAYGAQPIVVDRSVQDIALAESKVPTLRGRVRIRLLPLGAWQKDAETERRFEPVAVPLVPRSK
jgi:hypothetical protein